MFAKLGLAGQTSNNDNNDLPKKDDLSITSVLNTPVLRVGFVSLVAICCDDMRRELISTFECPPALAGQRTKSSSYSKGALTDQEAPQTKPKSQDQDISRQIQEELSSPEICALRQGALAFFDDWQVKLGRRMGAVLNVKSHMIKDARAKASAQAKQDREQSWQASEGCNQDTKQEPRFFIPQTPLAKLEESHRRFVLNCLLLLLLSLESYPAQSRVLLLRFTACLGLPSEALVETEATVANGLLDTAAKQMSADDSVEKHTNENANSRKWKVGLATVGGAALIGITGGLAAPLVVAGVGGVMGALGLGAVASLLGAVAGSSVLIGGLFGAYGGRMTGQVMERYAREVEDFKFLPAIENSEPVGLDSDPKLEAPTLSADEKNLESASERSRHRLRVAIGISGWLTTSTDVSSPWAVLSTQTIEPFALQWEINTLIRLGTSLGKVMQNYLLGGVSYVILRQTVLSTLMMGLWPLTILKVAKVADNPFSVAKSRADKAGKVLADALMAKAQGERPVTLIGFSMGARVIWSCLQALAEKDAFGLVENVVLMGAPVPANPSEWRKLRAMVAGRVVNAYSTDDWILGVLYRTSTVQLGVAGLQKVVGVTGVEDYDASRFVKGHTRWKFAVGQVLKNVGIEDVNNEMVEKEEQAWQKLEEKEKELEKTSERNSDLLTETGNLNLSDDDKKPHTTIGKAENGVKTGTTDQNSPTLKKRHTAEEDKDSDDEQLIQMLDLEPMPEFDSDGKDTKSPSW